MAYARSGPEAMLRAGLNSNHRFPSIRWDESSRPKGRTEYFRLRCRHCAACGAREAPARFAPRPGRVRPSNVTHYYCVANLTRSSPTWISATESRHI